MSEYVVHGDELKKIVRLGRRRPMPFAFCPSVGEDESLFATHRKKPPELIARVTRKDSGQTKVAYGTFVIQGKLMVLTCTKELPAIAKKLKKHMRAERLPLNIRVMDMTGREIEADIDAFDDGTDPFGEDEDDDDDDGDGFVRWNAAPSGPANRNDRLAERIGALKAPILALGGERGERLRELLAAVIGAWEGSRRDRAETLIARLEKEVAALMNSASRPQMAAAKPMPKRADAPARSDADDEEDDDDGDDEGDTPPAAAAPKPAPKEKAAAPEPERAETLRLARRVAALRRRAARIEAEAADRIMAALALVARALRTGDIPAAEAGLARIEPALDRAEARGAAQPGPA